MSGTSKRSVLSERLRRNLESRRRETEELAASELHRLGEGLRKHAGAELSRIESATAERAGVTRQRLSAALDGIEAESETLARHLRRAWVRPLAIGTSLCLGISLGSWGLTRWLSFRVQTLVGLEAQIEERERTLELLEGKTWGLDLHEGGNGKYVVLPEGALILDGRDRPQKAEWTVGGRAAIKLTLP